MEHAEQHGTPIEAESIITQRRALLAGLGGLAAGAFVAGKAKAGPLDPPAGPITSTGKTLTEVEPRIPINATNTPGDANSIYRITQPGSYYLTGNVTGESGKHGIEIAASGVTLDLNGFDLAGVPGMGFFDGVTVSEPELVNIEVRNGSVRNWGRTGVEIMASTYSVMVSAVRASDNAFSGIRVWSGTVSECTAYRNGDTGIVTATGSTVTGCVAHENGGNGIQVGSTSTVTECSAFGNSGHGIWANGSSNIVSCSSEANSLNGIWGGSGTHVSNCTTGFNTLNGIQALSRCRIVGNTCINNGFNKGDGAGLLITGSANRVEENNCIINDRGIEVLAGGNFILKNTCSDNDTNWVFAAGNAYGPIVATPAGAAVNGSTASGALGTTNPHANFTY